MKGLFRNPTQRTPADPFAGLPQAGSARGAEESPSGWFESSFDLRTGLEVRELSLEDFTRLYGTRNPGGQAHAS